jgi:hypothetical protein
MRVTAYGSHKLIEPIQDFLKDTRPPLIRVGQRVLEFWKVFNQLEKTSPYKDTDHKV